MLNVELSALENEGRGQIVSRPRVITADRVKAVVEQGTELPYQAKVGNGVSGVQFRRAALKLEVEPQITPHGHVILDLDVSKDSVGEQTAAGPAITPSMSRRVWRWRTAARWQSAGYIPPTNANMPRGSRCSVKSRYWVGFFAIPRVVIHTAN